MSRDEHAVDSELQYKVVEAVFNRIGRIWEIQVNGKIIRTTSEHPFYVVGRCQLDSSGNDASKQYLNDPNESSLGNDSLESDHFSLSSQVNPRKYSHQNQENFSRRESPDSWQNRQNDSFVVTSEDHISGVATIESAETYNEFEEPFEGGWIETAALRPGDQFIGFDNQLVTVEAIRDTQTYERVYNVSVSDWHTYFIGKEDWGWSAWGHNDDCSQKLAKNLEASGKKKPKKISEAAHIVPVLRNGGTYSQRPEKVQEAIQKAKQALEKVGIGINDAVNGFWTTKKGRSHMGTHRNKYFLEIGDQLNKAANSSTNIEEAKQNVEKVLKQIADNAIEGVYLDKKYKS